MDKKENFICEICKKNQITYDGLIIHYIESNYPKEQLECNISNEEIRKILDLNPRKKKEKKIYENINEILPIYKTDKNNIQNLGKNSKNLIRQNSFQINEIINLKNTDIINYQDNTEKKFCELCSIQISPGVYDYINHIQVKHSDHIGNIPKFVKDEKIVADQLVNNPNSNKIAIVNPLLSGKSFNSKKSIENKKENEHNIIFKKINQNINIPKNESDLNSIKRNNKIQISPLHSKKNSLNLDISKYDKNFKNLPISPIRTKYDSIQNQQFYLNGDSNDKIKNSPLNSKINSKNEEKCPFSNYMKNIEASPVNYLSSNKIDNNSHLSIKPNIKKFTLNQVSRKIEIENKIFNIDNNNKLQISPLNSKLSLDFSLNGKNPIKNTGISPSRGNFYTVRNHEKSPEFINKNNISNTSSNMKNGEKLSNFFSKQNIKTSPMRGKYVTEKISHKSSNYLNNNNFQNNPLNAKEIRNQNIISVCGNNNKIQGSPLNLKINSLRNQEIYSNKNTIEHSPSINSIRDQNKISNFNNNNNLQLTSLVSNYNTIRNIDKNSIFDNLNKIQVSPLRANFSSIENLEKKYEVYDKNKISKSPVRRNVYKERDSDIKNIILKSPLKEKINFEANHPFFNNKIVKNYNTKTNLDKKYDCFNKNIQKSPMNSRFKTLNDFSDISQGSDYSPLKTYYKDTDYKISANQINSKTCLSKKKKSSEKEVEELKEKVSSMEGMISNLKKLVKNVVNIPSNWEKQVDYLQLVNLKNNSDEYRKISNLFMQSYQKGKIQKITRIQNINLWRNFCHGKYQLKLKGNHTEKLLFHGTGEKDPKIIYSAKEEGFDIRHANPNGMFGIAIYFHERAKYSNDYKYTKDNINYLFVARVLVGDSINIKNSDRSLRLPPMKNDLSGERYDSVNSEGKFMIYNNFRAYPEYLIEYVG